MWETLWNLIALNRKIFICAISNDLEHPSIILFDDFKSLFSVVDSSDPAIDELLLNSCLVLLVSNMWQLNGVESVMLYWNEVPNKGKAILREAFDLVDHLIEAFLRLRGSLLAIVKDRGQLIKL